jgi:hypothetical protein
MLRDIGRAWWHALLLAAVFVGGCSGAEPVMELAQVAPPKAEKMRATQPVAMVGLQPMVGPPPALASKIVTRLNEAALRENIALVVDGNIKAPTALTGFMIAQAEPANVKFTFVWDVFGPGGARVGRITGEEAIPSASPPEDPWSGIPDNAIQSMAAKVIAGIVSSVPK